MKDGGDGGLPRVAYDSVPVIGESRHARVPLSWIP